MPGDIIGINDISKCIYYIRDNHRGRGMIIGDYKDNISLEVKNFTSLITFINIPNPIKVGFSPTIYCHTKQLKAKMTDFLAVIDNRTNQIQEKNPKEIKNGQKAVVVMEPIGEFACEKYKDNPYLGSFFIYENNNIIAVGKIIGVSNIKYKNNEILDFTRTK